MEKREYIEWLCERIAVDYEHVLNEYVTRKEIRDKLLDSLREIIEFVCEDIIEIIEV